jgi:peptide/nickel transport system permease protein
MIPVLLGVAFLMYTLMFFIPGDPVKMILGSNASTEDVANLTHELGLDKPFLTRFIDYVVNIITKFDFGKSFVSRKPIATEISVRFPYTLKLSLIAIVVSTFIGVLAGIVSAVKQYSVFDNLATVIALLGVSMPIFWFALMLILTFAIYWKVLPVSGSYGWKYWVLPVVTVGLTGAANIMRTTRSSMLETIRQDYIRTARAKGQSEKKVIFNHALKNALVPIITIVGMQFGGNLGGSVISETVFAIPGIGQYTIEAIKQRDMYAVMGSIIFLAFCVSVINLVVDLLYAVIDPRVKTIYTGKASKKRSKALNQLGLAGNNEK